MMETKVEDIVGKALMTKAHNYSLNSLPDLPRAKLMTNVSLISSNLPPNYGIFKISFYA